MAKDRIIQFRVTEKEYSDLKLKSEKHNGLSNYIRRLLTKNDDLDCEDIKYWSCSKNKMGLYVLEFRIGEEDKIYNYVVIGIEQLIELSRFFNVGVSDLLSCFEYVSSLMETIDYKLENVIHSLEELKNENNR